MVNCIGTASRWPAIVAFAAAGVFITAATTANVAYGWSRGTDTASSLTWAAVAVAVSAINALALPSFTRSIAQRQWGTAVIALIAFALAAAYSTAAALGSAAGGRMQGAAQEKAVSDERARAQSTYDRASADLARLPAARPVAELEAMRTAAMKQPQRYGCAAINGSLALSCPGIDTELARARQRERLQEAMATASGQLTANRPGKVVNSDAKVLTRYLAALGLDIEEERLNDLLILLSVVMIECGSGPSLALGMAFSGPVQGAPASAPATDTQTARKPPAAVRGPSVNVLSAGGMADCPISASDLVEWLGQQGGRTETSMRRLAEVLGRSRSSVHEELRRLQAAGVLTATSGARGTLLALARPN